MNTKDKAFAEAVVECAKLEEMGFGSHSVAKAMFEAGYELGITVEGCADCEKEIDRREGMYWCGTSMRCPECHEKRMRGEDDR